MLSKMTLGKKLVASVGVILALTLALGISALWSVRAMNALLETATQRTTRSLQLSGKINEAAGDMLAGMRGIVMFSYRKLPENVRSSQALADRAAETWQKSMDEFRVLNTNEESRRIIDTLQEQLTAWRSVIADIAQTAGRGEPDAAADIAIARALPIYQANERDTDRLAEIQDRVLAAQREEGSSLNRTCWWLVILALALSLAAGAGALFLVHRTAKTLQNAASELGQSAAQFSNAAGQIASSSQSLAQGASEQAASIEETSASAEEITAMARKNADGSRAAADLMVQTGQVVAEANRTLEEMEASMQQINESSDKIRKINKVIDEIAFQTNILALNAAVEAARAGDAGLGFAVVADEVRNLAQRSAQAARDTAILIEESIARSSEGRVKLDEVSQAIHAITDKAQKVKVLVDDVHVGSSEQTRGIEQISNTITQMQQQTQTSAASAEEAASAGQELNAQALALGGIVGQLQDLVGTSDQDTDSLRPRRSNASSPVGYEQE